MDCACGVVAHILDRIPAAVLGQDSSQVSRKVRKVVDMVAVQPALQVAQAGKVWSGLVPLLPEAAQVAVPQYLCVPLLDYS